MFCFNYRSQIVPKNSSKDVCQEQTDGIGKISDPTLLESLPWKLKCCSYVFYYAKIVHFFKIMNELRWFQPLLLRTLVNRLPQPSVNCVQEIDWENKEYEAVTMLVTTELEDLFDILIFIKLIQILWISVGIQRFVNNPKNLHSKKIRCFSTKEL